MCFMTALASQAKNKGFKVKVPTLRCTNLDTFKPPAHTHMHTGIIHYDPVKVITGNCIFYDAHRSAQCLINGEAFHF